MNGDEFFEDSLNAGETEPRSYDSGQYNPPTGVSPPSEFQPTSAGYVPQAEDEAQQPPYGNLRTSDPQDQLNQQPYFEYSRCNGRKKALLIGINYYGSDYTLEGCINDAHNVEKLIVERFGYDPSDIIVLSDDTNDERKKPTRANIIRAMNWLVDGAQRDDSLFLHYSGHGTQADDQGGEEEDGKDEGEQLVQTGELRHETDPVLDCSAICPVDFATEGLIIDDEIHDICIKPLPPGCRLTAIFDSCHSGTVLDLPYVYSTEGKIKEPNFLAAIGTDLLGLGKTVLSGPRNGWLSAALISAKTAYNGPQAESRSRRMNTSAADVVQWAGCKDDQTDADAQEAGEATGAMSFAFVAALTKYPKQSYQQLLISVREEMKGKFTQKPQLSSCHPGSTGDPPRLFSVNMQPRESTSDVDKTLPALPQRTPAASSPPVLLHPAPAPVASHPTRIWNNPQPVVPGDWTARPLVRKVVPSPQGLQPSPPLPTEVGPSSTSPTRTLLSSGHALRTAPPSYPTTNHDGGTGPSAHPWTLLPSYRTGSFVGTTPQSGLLTALPPQLPTPSPAETHPTTSERAISHTEEISSQENSVSSDIVSSRSRLTRRTVSRDVSPESGHPSMPLVSRLRSGDALRGTSRTSTLCEDTQALDGDCLITVPPESAQAATSETLRSTACVSASSARTTVSSSEILARRLPISLSLRRRALRLLGQSEESFRSASFQPSPSDGVPLGLGPTTPESVLGSAGSWAEGHPATASTSDESAGSREGLIERNGLIDSSSDSELGSLGASSRRSSSASEGWSSASESSFSVGHWLRITESPPPAYGDTATSICIQGVDRPPSYSPRPDTQGPVPPPSRNKPLPVLPPATRRGTNDSAATTSTERPRLPVTVGPSAFGGPISRMDPRLGRSVQERASGSTISPPVDNDSHSRQCPICASELSNYESEPRAATLQRDRRFHEPRQPVEHVEELSSLLNERMALGMQLEEHHRALHVPRIEGEMTDEEIVSEIYELRERWDFCEEKINLGDALFKLFYSMFGGRRRRPELPEAGGGGDV